MKSDGPVRGEGRIFRRGARWWIAYYAPKAGEVPNIANPAA